jgi:sugar/nucleoside kinase (ribokinase family)
MKRGYPVRTVDTTGAGDAYLGAVLYRILRREGGIERITLEELDGYCNFANAVGALVTTKLGAMDSLPDREEVDSR